jgi:hypothetical protein
VTSRGGDPQKSEAVPRRLLEIPECPPRSAAESDAWAAGTARAMPGHMLRALVLSLSVVLFACGDSPLVSTEDALACGFTEKPANVEQCLCIGGNVNEDPGDGSAHCNVDEIVLARIPFEIEGAVCCLEL